MLTRTSKVLRSVVLHLLVFWAVGASAAAQVQTSTTGRVIGYVYTANNSVVADAELQLRDTVSGGVAAVTRTSAAGEFTFAITPGAYVVELVNSTGSAMALGHPFTVAAGETVATFVRISNMLPTFMIPSQWELAAGVIGSWRDGSRSGAPGLGVMFGFSSGRPAFVAEISGVRRDGHNDWRALGGLRLGIVEGSRGALFAHAIAGLMIRSGKSGLALGAGLGVEVGGPGRSAFRLQAEVTSDTANGRRAAGGRVSAWVVVR